MKTNESNLAPPGAPRGALNRPVQALGAPGGVFAPMKTPKEYEIEIESLRAMNLKLQLELTKALEVVAEAHRNQHRKDPNGLRMDFSEDLPAPTYREIPTPQKRHRERF